MLRSCAPPVALLFLWTQLHSSSSSLHTGTGEQCHAAPFVPGHHQLGRGFDVLSLQRKEAHLMDLKTNLTNQYKCTLLENLQQGGQLQKLPLSATGWRSFPKCPSEIHTSQMSSASQFIRAFINATISNFKRHMENSSTESWGTDYSYHKAALALEKQDTFTFAHYSATCIHYKLRVSSHTPLSPEFAEALSRLPDHYTEQATGLYRELVETYGTHYIRQTMTKQSDMATVVDLLLWFEKIDSKRGSKE
uniref:MACPF domain-containing protein n=1 Tax=Knipowitschia caucasica TaxID=637954 RepID=A0AAV2LGN0_KNICA